MADELTTPINTDSTTQALRQAIRRDLAAAKQADEAHLKDEPQEPVETEHAGSETPERGQNVDITV